MALPLSALKGNIFLPQVREELWVPVISHQCLSYSVYGHLLVMSTHQPLLLLQVGSGLFQIVLLRSPCYQEVVGSNPRTSKDLWGSLHWWLGLMQRRNFVLFAPCAVWTFTSLHFHKKKHFPFFYLSALTMPCLCPRGQHPPMLWPHTSLRMNSFSFNDSNCSAD